MGENFRSYSAVIPSRMTMPTPRVRQAVEDPLAELARLIDQSDALGDFGRDSLDDAAPAAGLDWAANDSNPEQNPAEDRYVPPPIAASYPPYSSSPNYSLPDADYADERPAAMQYSPPAAPHNGPGEDARDNAMAYDTLYRDQLEPPVSTGRQSPALAPQAQDDHYEAGGQQYDSADDQSYASDEYSDEAPYRRRRSGFIVVIAVLGLAVLGTAGAFGYRAMFGASMLPTFPPIIQAGDGPNKIVSAKGDSPVRSFNQAGETGGSGEKSVSREEPPVEPAQNSAAPGSMPPGVPALDTPAVGAPAPVPNGLLVPPAAAVRAAITPEPKKIHTETIRPDGNADTGSVPLTPPRPPAVPPPPTGSNAPLELVPSQGDAPTPPPVRTRTALARPTAPSTATGSAASPSAGGGYAVQVASEHSEAEAESAFHTLQAKYPNQLGGREPIVRRADLGAKGTYYRALVGPFASMEQAAGVCSSLKAAGGNCIVKRN